MKAKHSMLVVPVMLALLASSCAHRNKNVIQQNYGQEYATINTASSVGQVEVVADLDINPGNVAVSHDGRIFTSIHQMRPASYRLVEIDRKSGGYIPFPDESWNRAGQPGPNNLNAPLGIQIDSKNRLWVMDNGAIEPAEQTPKLLAFNLESGKQVFRYDFTPAIGPRGSMIQDLAVDDASGFVYLADLGRKSKPALVVLNTKTLEAHRYENLKEFQPENVDIKIDGKTYERRVGLDPITLSADKQTLFFGSMNGISWYSIPTSVLRNGSSLDVVSSSITKVGNKPVSDGAATDGFGNHYFTDLNHNAITVLRPNGTSEIIAQNPILSWPDNISIGNDGWLYVSVNQLHKTPFFNHGVEGSVPPYRIVRVKPDAN